MFGNSHNRLVTTFSSENIGKYWRYCQLYGVRNATRLALRRLRKPKGAPPLNVTPLLPLPVPASQGSLVDKTVSIVIPTKNAGAELRLLLKKLKAQVGLKPCEIILVDSGSSDDTATIAQAEGAKVVVIKSEEFDHAFARNQGAASATGDYILFMVQDALPLTNFWLWEMVTALQANSLAAVSCAEYPRSDSDLFYQFLIHSQYGGPGLNQNRLLAWDNSCSSYLGLRSNAQLSNVAALIRSDAFMRYGYRKAYAEDLDLGIRLIRDGHRLGFLHSTRVLHSHNRPAHYFLKRAYTDVRFLVDVFPNFSYPEVEHRERLFSDIFSLYERMNLLAQTMDRLPFPQTLVSLMEVMQPAVFELSDHPHASGKGADPQLYELIRTLRKDLDAESVALNLRRNMLLPHVSNSFQEFRQWLCAIYDEADSALAHEILRSLEKMFALHCGNHLAYLFLTCSNRGCLDERLSTLDRELTAGV